MSAALPVCPVRLEKGKDATVLKGMPWIYAGDIIDSSEWRMVPPGSVVAIENHKGQHLGVGYINPASQIACRVLTLAQEPVNAAFFEKRLTRALALREKLIGAPYYRLAHAEADGLPGLLLDRFGGVVVAQAGTAGMDRLRPHWLEALERIVAPDAIVLRNDTAARELEALPREVQVIKGSVAELVEVHENGCVYYADLLHGQKTGWFYDQRDNHRLVADLAAGKTVLDVYAHSGGFGLLAAMRGATEVTLVDSSALALGLAQKAAGRNGVAAHMLQADAFEAMEELTGEERRYDIVIADPPAFVKAKKDIASGLKGYAKMARLAAALVQPEGYLFTASCSHHASRGAFNQAILDGVAKAGRKAAIMKQTGAAPDHPRHPQLPQSEYLKGLLLKING